MLARMANADHYLNDVERWIDENTSQDEEYDDLSGYDAFHDPDLFGPRRRTRR